MEFAVAEAHRNEWAFVLAATVRVTRDIDRAEECVQEAYARALADWKRHGVPLRPGAWLTTVSRRIAIDSQRRHETQGRVLPLLISQVDERESSSTETEAISDDRLPVSYTHLDVYKRQSLH